MHARFASTSRRRNAVLALRAEIFFVGRYMQSLGHFTDAETTHCSRHCADDILCAIELRLCKALSNIMTKEPGQALTINSAIGRTSVQNNMTPVMPYKSYLWCERHCALVPPALLNQSTSWRDDLSQSSQGNDFS